ncbi:type III-B CRISPR module RAMP protein Cmr4 [Thermococcus barophilus]|uniref:CRISPR-associated RAMP protein, Cmr4 family n=1 Tax=Thermococcus barophilus TaxID=55802 RepID=A0A0S1XEM4_THEBA|nr:type III-B CRISPR module RAMP protein Cmr4 [Thermococcus barophilus]ALM76266.1 CRISPR-associated RAMP protein, Cmr4 family [Thermococcus barophilus]
MFEKKLILGIYSITPVHAGSGAEISVIDLPIQRERHTGFPVIWGQSLKGVLRSEFPGEDSDPKKTVIFGPPTDKAHEHAGAVSVGDAKILLFPVRSAKGVFAYITCPLVLERFRRDMELAGGSAGFKIPDVEKTEAIISKDSSLVVSTGSEDRVVLEEVVLKANANNGIINRVVDEINKISPISIDAKRIAIVSDDMFSSFVKMATEIVARIRIDATTGTVAEGGLWYEEFLPSDTVMYSVIAIANPRVKNPPEEVSTADGIARKLAEVFNGKFLQIGGDETVGKGFVKVKLVGVNGNEPQEP